ncbi:metallophosphoesterase [Burkholderia multivorans]|uniref:metallophosphoesterase n=1 Tax=Burkholderia multivorans TaxID=87883 RepID=UPI001C2148DE|nr:metallophosphoesterase [Burkholderia multivorans]MBU9199843.1 metallophosphoesterase [Burkholderia multivorans]MDN8079038.1 metallophosphoesterase [Burkholderia multivorans]
MKNAALPRILLHSDLHLESGPFTLPDSSDTSPAVAVFAGDVCSGDGGPAALRALSTLPTVYVSGNHEFWGGDYFERLDAIRARAKEFGVHFLENDAVVLEGVRFLGATFWTNYGGRDDALLSYGLWGMRDHRKIKAARWWTSENRARFVKQFGEHALEKFEGMFNPLLALELHRKSLAWLKRELDKPFSGPTVVVTHHAPSFESLRRAGISDLALNPDHWVRRMNDDLNLTKVGSYASDLLRELSSDLRQAGVRYWLHGHLHQAMHYGVRGILVATNPRGRVYAPLTKESARGFALFGYPVSDEEVERSQQEHRENPERGDGFGYDKSRAVDLNEPGMAVLEEAYQTVLEALESRRAELKALRPLARSKRSQIADLAAHRADTHWNAIMAAVRTFGVSMAEQLGHSYHDPERLDWLLHGCMLAKFNEFAHMSNRGDFEDTVHWRQIEEARTAEERARYGYRPEQFTAQHYLRQLEASAQKIATMLKRVPKACEALHKEKLCTHAYYANR